MKVYYIKQCNRCKQEKEITEFPPRGKSVQPYCFTCKREYDREFYQKTIEKRRSLKRNNSKNIRKRNADLLKEYLVDKSCLDCGIKDPVVLEFDHRGNKKYNVSDMLRQCHSTESILEEIKKCDIRCANCHRRKTAKQFGWNK